MYLRRLLGRLVSVAAARAPRVHAVQRAMRCPTCCIFIVLGVILGGRIGYTFFYNYDAAGHLTILRDPLVIFRIWEGGMSFHGGLIGVIDGAGLVCTQPQADVRLRGRTSSRRWCRSACCSAASATSSTPSCGARRRLCPGRWSFRPIRSSCRGIRRCSTRLSSKASCCCACCCGSRASRGRRWRCPGLFLLLYGTFRWCRGVRAHAGYVQLGYLAFGWLTMGQILCIPMLAAGALMLGIAYGKPPRRPA
jgi:phosphatidylglycerol:prolipoprotein diacylglycerol transferase